MHRAIQLAPLWRSICRKLRREIEALPLCLLCNRLRATLRGQSDKKHQDDDGWGSIIPRRYIIQNIDIEETVLDIPIFAQTPSGGDTDDARLEWGNVNALISVSDSPYQDLRDTYTNQAFRRTSRLVERHALWMRSHYVTVSGPLIRLWQFTRTTYCTSRAYDFRKDADRLDIGRILTLLVASDQDSILRQWVPPTIMDVQGPESHGNAATSQTEKWEWLEGSPQVLRVSGEIWQARTTIFAGHARLIVPPGTQPAQDQRLDRLELDGKSSQGRLTLIKCCLLPEHLLGHEHLMQEYVADLPGAPKPIGLLPLDMAPLGPPAMAGQSSAKFYPQALLYQQRMGSELPYDMCEKDFCKLLLHFTGELEEYARRGVHYRNFDPDNLLYAPDDKDGPRVILIGHENMRLDGQSGPSPNAGRAGGDDSDDDPKSLEAIVKDDLHGTHPLLEPSAHSELRWRLKSAEDYRLECASLEQRSREDSARIQRQGEKSYSRLRLYAHSHLDDLESCCYMHLLYVLRRSLQPYDEKRRRLEKNLVEDFTKARMWTKAHEWAWSLSRIFENMSKGWRDMMEELNVTIFTAQEKRRKELEDDPDLMNMPLEALFKLSPTEEECFRACREIYSNYLRDDKLSSKPFVAPLTYWAQEKQKEAQKEMAAAREATGASGAYDAQDEAEVDSGS